MHKKIVSETRILQENFNDKSKYKKKIIDNIKCPKKIIDNRKPYLKFPKKIYSLSEI